MKNKVLGLALLTIAIIGISKLLIIDKNKTSLYKTKSSKIKKNTKNIFINQVWHDDIKRLIKSGEIPNAWSKINQIIFIATDPETKELTKYLKAPVKINKSGEYRLEISVISHQSDLNKTQILLQHNIIQNDNDDTIWEINRTYNLKNN